MPRTVTFKFDVQDIEAELKEAEVKKARAEARATRIREGEIGPIIARQIANDDGDLDARYLELMGEADLTPDMIIDQGEKPQPASAVTVDEDEARKGVGPRFPFEMFRRRSSK